MAHDKIPGGCEQVYAMKCVCTLNLVGYFIKPMVEEFDVPEPDSQVVTPLGKDYQASGKSQIQTEHHYHSNTSIHGYEAGIHPGDGEDSISAKTPELTTVDQKDQSSHLVLVQSHSLHPDHMLSVTTVVSTQTENIPLFKLPNVNSSAIASNKPITSSPSSTDHTPAVTADVATQTENITSFKLPNANVSPVTFYQPITSSPSSTDHTIQVTAIIGKKTENSALFELPSENASSFTSNQPITSSTFSPYHTLTVTTVSSKKTEKIPLFKLPSENASAVTSNQPITSSTFSPYHTLTVTAVSSKKRENIPLFKLPNEKASSITSNQPVTSSTSPFDHTPAVAGVISTQTEHIPLFELPNENALPVTFNQPTTSSLSSTVETLDRETTDSVPRNKNINETANREKRSSPVSNISETVGNTQKGNDPNTDNTLGIKSRILSPYDFTDLENPSSQIICCNRTRGAFGPGLVLLENSCQTPIDRCCNTTTSGFPQVRNDLPRCICFQKQTSSLTVCPKAPMPDPRYLPTMPSSICCPTVCTLLNSSPSPITLQLQTNPCPSQRPSSPLLVFMSPPQRAQFQYLSQPRCRHRK